MKRTRTSWLLAVALVASWLPCAAEPTPAAQAALDRYLATDCETGETESALEGLLAHGSLAGELERIVTDGPDAGSVAELRASIEAAWAERQAFLDGGGRTGLEAQTEVGVLATPREAWIERRLRRHDLTTRERAAVAWLAAEPARAIRGLRRIARQTAPGIAEMIRETLATHPASAGLAPAPTHDLGSRRRTISGRN